VSVNDEVLVLSVQDKVAVLTVNRPGRMNALNTQTCDALVRTLEELDRDPAVHVVILTGAGDKAFIAGADIAEFAGQIGEGRERQLDCGCELTR
jgi:enoyl-CoA hydratase